MWAEITVERVKRYRPLGIRLPVNGRKVVGVLERIDTLATAGSSRNTRRNVIRLQLVSHSEKVKIDSEK